MPTRFALIIALNQQNNTQLRTQRKTNPKISCSWVILNFTQYFPAAPTSAAFF